MKTITNLIIMLGTICTLQPEISAQILKDQSSANDFSVPTKSFYKSKGNWRNIVDTSWGPGLPLEEKLNIYDTYTDSLTKSFAGFDALGISPSDWETIKTSYRQKITDTTSRGDFAAIMSHLSYSLNDVHGWAFEELENGFMPGYPVVGIGWLTNNRLGAVLTVLPDSSLVVLSSIENHPLNLQSGDIVLGYEGVPWKTLIDELLAADLPMNFMQRGAKSARRHSELLSAALNWHLFDTIDIVKFSSEDTMHLSVAPLLDLPADTLDVWEEGPRENISWCNEQLSVPGVPMLDPKDLNTTCISYGIVEGTNIGYIYIYVEFLNGDVGVLYNVWEKFQTAYIALQETEGLIIDLRLNNGGVPPIDNKTFSLMFNEFLYTFDAALRCNSSDFSLCPANHSNWFSIPGNPMSLYDRPLAILIGPNTISAGEILAREFKYHPMVNFFGKPLPGSLASFNDLKDFPGWKIRCSNSDFYEIATGESINLKEFPVDVPVWFNVEDVANGIDPVVEKALEWIDSLSYTHDVSLQSTYLTAGETARIIAEVENPQKHEISVFGKVMLPDGSIIDSIAFSNEESSPDSIWGVTWSMPAGEAFYCLNVTTEDNLAGSLRTLPNVVQFTSAGPVNFDYMTITSDDTIANPGDRLRFRVNLKNNGTTVTIPNVKASLKSLSEFATVSNYNFDFGDIKPGISKSSSLNYTVGISEDCPIGTLVPLVVNISSNDYNFWTDTFYVQATSIEDLTSKMAIIYPNPVSDLLNIELSVTTDPGLCVELLDLSGKVIYNKLINFTGQTIHTIDLSSVKEGIYIIRLKNSEYVISRKLIITE